MNTIFGKKLGRYTLLEELGAGGMATVYNAYDNRMERNVALKVILPSKQHSELFLERFNLEARAVAQLSHTNVVKILDYGEEDGQPFLVMEFVPAGTLKDRMEAPLPWQEAARLLAPVARALEYVHSQKIIHRDIKPANILLDENNQPKISDFGIVKLLENEDEAKTSTGVGVGTPDYMSPEQGMGKEVDERADIYALGVVLFEMITGQKPYSAESPMGVVIKQVTDSFPKPRKIRKDLPKIVEEVILKATAKDPDKRFSKMAEFADTLDELANGSKTGLKNTQMKLGTRKKKPVIVVGFSLLAVIALGAASWFINPGNIQSTIKSYLKIIEPAPQPQIQLVYITATPIKITPTPSSPGAQKTPTPRTQITATPKSVDTSDAGADNRILLANQPLPNLTSGINSSGVKEISRWGIGNFNEAIWTEDDGSIALAGTAGIFIYDTSDFDLMTFIDTPEWINAILFSEDGSEIISGSLQNTITMWDATSGQKKRTYTYSSPEGVGVIGGETKPQITCLALSKNGESLAAGFSNGVVNVWKYSTGNLIFRDAQSGKVTDIAFSPDNRYLTTSGVKGFSTWNLSNSKLELLIPVNAETNTFLLSPDGNNIISGGKDWVVRYWETSGRLLKTFNAGAQVNTIATTLDGKLMAAGMENGSITLWDIENWEEISSIEGHPDGIRDLSFSSSGNQLLSTSRDEDLLIWSIPDLKKQFTLNENIKTINRLEFSKNEKWLAANSIDDTVRLWDIAKGSIAYTFSGYLPKGIAFSPDNQYLVTATAPAVAWEEGFLSVWDLKSGELVATLDGYQSDQDIYFSPDGKYLISGNLYNAIIWDVSTFFKLRTHGGHNAGCGVYYSPQNDVLAVFSTAGILYEYNDNIKKICALREKTLISVKFIPAINSTSVLVKQLNNSREEEGIIFSWNYTTPPKPKPMDDNQIFLGASPDKETVFIASQKTNMLYLMNANLSPISSFPNYAEYQYVTATSSQNKYIAIGGNDGVIHIWGRQ